jgi:hypothetical protein
MAKRTIPFVYGSTVSTEAYTNRENDALRLKSNLVGGISTLLISPRRWGKSSLVEKVLLDLEREEPDMFLVSLDLFSVADEKEFLELFARKVITASSNKWEEWLATVKKYFKRLTPKLTVGVNPKVDFTITFDLSDLEQHKDEILNLPELIAKEKKSRYIICIDEFQQLRDIDVNYQLEKRMRAVWQRQKNVSYCLYGSKRHMMNDIFSNASNAFYKFGDLMFLPKIAGEKWVEFIMKQFKRTGKSIAKQEATLISDSMKNHSWYVQQLSHYAWTMTTDKCTAEIIALATEQVIQSNTPLFQREIELLNQSQINLIKAALNGEKQLSSKATIDKYKLGTSALVVKNRRLLYEADFIDVNENTFELMDPVFEIYFRRLYRINSN